LKQAIGNLLHNALKFTQAGGEIHLSVYQEQNEAVIHVEDNGIGINT
jgi:signal transduction histidine kinase